MVERHYIPPDAPAALAAMKEGRYLEAGQLFERSSVALSAHQRLWMFAMNS